MAFGKSGKITHPFHVRSGKSGKVRESQGIYFFGSLSGQEKYFLCQVSLSKIVFLAILKVENSKKFQSDPTMMGPP